jgi:hypothetical protein
MHGNIFAKEALEYLWDCLGMVSLVELFVKDDDKLINKIIPVVIILIAL